MVGDCAVGRTRPVTADALRNFPLPRTLTQRAGSLGLSAGAKDHGGAGGGGGGCGTDDAGWFCSELVSSWSTTLIDCATIVTVVSATRYKTPRSSEVRTPPVRCGGERGMGTRFTPPAMKGHTQVDLSRRRVSTRPTARRQFWASSCADPWPSIHTFVPFTPKNRQDASPLGLRPCRIHWHLPLPASRWFGADWPA